MAGLADYGGYPPSNETVIYAVSQAPSFDLVFESTSTALFWFLLIAHGGLGLYHVLKGQWRGLQRWPLYLMMLGYVVVTCIDETIALIYTMQARAGSASDAVYLVYIFFWHASNASFLVLLLALSSGYCITRGDLEGHKAKVIVIPAIVFVAGIASDFTFVYVQSTQQLSTAADRYNIVQMTAWESAVWFIGSLANIMSFILAWIYVFDSTQLEIKALDDAQAALTGRRPEGEEAELPYYESAGQSAAAALSAPPRRPRVNHESDEEDHVARPMAGGRAAANGGGGAPGARPLGTTSQRVGLLYGMEDSAAARADPEAGENKETVADHVEYTVRKQLLSRFYFGVCGYLIVSIMVIILPAFFNVELQNTIVVLQFLVKYAFTLLLAWVFRPGKDSPYLQVGLNENDAEDLGVAGLDTELAVTEYQGNNSNNNQAGSNGTSSQPRFGASAAGAPQLPVSTPAAGSALAPPPASQSRSKPDFAALARGQLPPPAQQQQKPQFTLTDNE